MEKIPAGWPVKTGNLSKKVGTFSGDRRCPQRFWEVRGQRSTEVFREFRELTRIKPESISLEPQNTRTTRK